jgi:hypothetical protein
MKILPRLRPTRTGRLSTPERRAGERRILLAGLAVSLALHVLLIPMAGRWLDPEVRVVPVPREEQVAEPEQAIRAVRLADGLREPEPVEPVVEPVPAPPPPPAPPREGPERPEPEVERRALAERLAPRVVDPRLWRPMIILPREPTLQDVQDRVAAAIEMLSDSALAEAERAVRAREWTVEDARGGRWGISPGKIHLGSLTLPLPLFFPPDMEAEARNAYWYELDTQLDRAEFLENFEGRVRAIRERRDRERADRRGNDRGGS